jgi:solute carrier family 35 protein F5
MIKLTNFHKGILAISAVVLLWTISGFLLEFVLKNDFPSPFFSTYLSIATFQLYLVGYLFARRAKERQSVESPLRDLSSSTVNSEKRFYVVDKGEDESIQKAMYTARETFKISLTFGILYFLANYTANVGYGKTHVGSATILMSTSGKRFSMILRSIFHPRYWSCF